MHTVQTNIQTMLIDVPFSLFEVPSAGHAITNRLFEETLSSILPSLRILLLRFKPHENIHLSSLQHVFQQAKNLKGLIVGSHQEHREWLSISLGWLLPESPSIKHITLENLVFTHEEFETVFLPFCFAPKTNALDVYEAKIWNEIPNLNRTGNENAGQNDAQRVRFLDLVFPDSDDEKHDPTWIPSADDLQAGTSDTESDEEDEYTE
ncbi:hypothetical protein BDV19DRAFT_384480 [Aspergillus venezuelensis]